MAGILTALVTFVGSSEETTETQVSMPSNQRYYLYMRAPPGVHDVKFHDVRIRKYSGLSTEDLTMEKGNKLLSNDVPATATETGEETEGIEQGDIIAQDQSSSIPVFEVVPKMSGSDVAWI